MLRSYTTVIRDSFRAALKSKVLTIALGLIVLILLALAPFHLRESQDLTLSYGQHVPNPSRLATRMVEHGKSGDRLAVAHIWNMLSDEVQTELEAKASESDTDSDDSKQRRGPPQGNAAARNLIDELNTLLSTEDLYDEAAFKGQRLGDEAKSLIDRGASRSQDENRRLNRLLLSTALRRDISPPKASQLDFYYFGWHWDFMTTSVSHSTFAGMITNQLPVFFDKFVMSIGIFIALLVTASIIPEMLEPGSLNLLLSKPVHRWALLLTKYIGGCVFTLLCAGLFFSGIWLWLGIQLNIWDSSILYSIPVYVLVFAMYYSVSVLAGIWFRSPILSIVFAILFWGVCTLVGYGNLFLDNQHYNAAPRQLLATNDSALAVNTFQKTKRWDSDWKTISVRSGESASEQEAMEEAIMEGFVSYTQRLDEFADFPGPAYNPETNRALVVRGMSPDGRIPNTLQAGLSDGNDNWSVGSRVRLPNATRQVFYSKRFQWLAIDTSGRVFQLDMTEKKEPAKPKADEKKAATDSKDEKKKPTMLGGLMNKVKPKKKRAVHKAISASNLVDVGNVSSASLNPKDDKIAVYSQGELIVLAPNEEGRYERTASKALGNHDNDRMSAFVQYRGDRIFVAFGNSHFFLVNAKDLSVVDEQIIDDRAAIRTFEAAESGKYVAAVLRDGQLWVYDASAKNVISSPRAIPDGDVMAAAFNKQDQLWVGTRFQAAQLVNLDSGEQKESLQPKASTISNIYRYVVRPLYRVFPKPSEFYKLISHLSASGDTSNNPDVDLLQLPQRDNPWSPVTSGLTFTVLMLLLACFVFQRQDF